MARNNEIESPSINILRKGTEIIGDINCSGDIRIDGILKGTLVSEGKVVVGESGVIEGKITCKNADISGTIKATINVKELLQLKATASITSDINTNKLSIEPGANFTGSCNMGSVIKGIKNEQEKRESKKEVEQFA
jgi:cytoskeletal protein CcmA (bactofilin family)